MSYAREEGASASQTVHDFFIEDLISKREELGLTQKEMAAAASVSPSLWSKIEKKHVLPAAEVATAADDMLQTGEHFQRLWPIVIRYAYPSWFRPWVELEERATQIRSVQIQLIPGLLQTEAYARAMFEAARLDADRVEELVTGRISRQRILDRSDRPELWMVLDEHVLYRNIAAPPVMREQFQALLTAMDAPRTVLQVLPQGISHAALDGAFSVLEFGEPKSLPVVYADGFAEGQILADPKASATALRAYDLCAAEAHSPSRSADIVAHRIKELS